MVTKNNIIVTGDSGGLGSKIVESILSCGIYGVIGISRTNNEAIQKLQNKYKSYIHINFDLNNPELIKELYKYEIKKYGLVYGLVNNSAFAYDDIVTNANLGEIERMYRVNVYSPIMLTKYAVRDMILNKTNGSIVFISSVSAHTGYKGLSMYASTKGALEVFSNNVAREWGKYGIRSNCVSPGFMETKISSSLTDVQKNKIYSRTSLKKEINIESVAKTVYFLLSDDSKSITGTTICVDNGTI